MKPMRALLVLLLCLAPPVSATDSDAVHKGVATCASALCHGSAREKPESPILRNEYLTWQRHDAHAKAYRTLLSRESRVIADKLGIGPAHEAKVCLDCHTDNVPEDRRGKQFLLSDGVGCEACHGGAGRWLESHTSREAIHAENVEKGLVPLEKADVRAGVCQDCHIGGEERFAGHDIMGAGHPRLQFELMTYSLLQPYHHRMDADYHRRKPEADPPAMLWAKGQVAAARRMMAGLRGERFMATPLWPELAFFDCQACHAAMSADKWAPREPSRGLEPGSVRLNDSALVMVLALAEVLPSGEPAALLADIRALHRASRQGHDPVRQAALALDRRLQVLSRQLDTLALDAQRQRRLLATLARFGGGDQFNDYMTAEQVAMAVQVLLRHGEVEPGEAIRPHLDPLFDSLDDTDRLDVQAFRRAMRRLASQLGKES